MQNLINFFEALSDRELEAATASVAEQERITRLENAFIFAKLALDERGFPNAAVPPELSLGSQASGE